MYLSYPKNITSEIELSHIGWPPAVMIRKLCDRDGTPTISLDKGDLRLDGIVGSDGSIQGEQEMHVQRLGRG